MSNSGAKECTSTRPHPARAGRAMRSSVRRWRTAQSGRPHARTTRSSFRCWRTAQSWRPHARATRFRPTLTARAKRRPHGRATHASFRCWRPTQSGGPTPARRTLHSDTGGQHKARGPTPARRTSVRRWRTTQSGSPHARATRFRPTLTASAKRRPHARASHAPFRRWQPAAKRPHRRPRDSRFIPTLPARAFLMVSFSSRTKPRDAPSSRLRPFVTPESRECGSILKRVKLEACFESVRNCQQKEE